MGWAIWLDAVWQRERQDSRQFVALFIYRWPALRVAPTAKSMSDQENPYSETCPDPTQNELDKDAWLEETEGNLEFTFKLVRFCSIGGGIFTSIYAFTWVMGIYYILPLQWTWLDVIQVSRVFFVIAFSLFTWRSWLFASTIKNLPVDDSVEFAKYVENQTWVWLVIALIVFLLLAATGLAFSASYVLSRG